MAGKEQTANELSFAKVDYAELPPALREVVDAEGAAEQILAAPDDCGGQYLLIYLGERRSGGYDVQIEKIEKVRERIFVAFQETTPARGRMVTQALTYPWIAVKIDHNLPVSVSRELK